jgi:flavin-dependent dehydrogenase
MSVVAPDLNTASAARSDPEPSAYDVVFIGGAFSSASTALLLLRERPGLRVLIVEKAVAFDQKVGEATTEMSAMFLTRELALWQHLEAEHLPKEGLRYWSANDRVTSHADASETGGFLRSTVPSFQLRRDVLDEHLLRLAVDAGAELVRPARVRDIELAAFDNRVTVAHTIDGVERSRVVRCRWLLDGSGRACVLGKKLGLIDWNDEHPIAAIWARWDNVRHIDDLAARAGGALAAGNVGSRRLGTNHYIGHGYWVWVIPLGNGQTSVGVVFDKRIHRLHEVADRRPAYEAFLRRHPALAELLAGATPDAADLRGLSRVAYVARQYMGDGWALLGDAAAFIDPYYSPGLDHAAFCAHATAEVVLEQLGGGHAKDGRTGDDTSAARSASPARFAALAGRHNGRFVRSYHRFFKSAYRDKYFLLGEHDLTTASFLIDTAFYYIFLVVPAYRFKTRFVNDPVLAAHAALPVYLFMRLAKWRFLRIAATRAAAGEAGARNDGRRTKAFFNLALAPVHMLLRGMKLWAYAEADALRLRAKVLARRLTTRADGRLATMPPEPTSPAMSGVAPEPVG